MNYNNFAVDESYSDKLEANLYFASVLVPGATCDDGCLSGPGGAVYVRKLTSTVPEPGVPGRDFTDEDLGDELIQIHLNNNFQRSRKIYGVQAAAVAADLKDEALSEAQKEVRSGWEAAGVACLIAETTAVADTTAPTAATAKGMVIDVRTALIENGAKPDVVLCAPAFYALILKAAGTEFLPVTNETMAATGNVGTYLGMTWVEAGVMAKGSAKYYDSADTLQTVDFSKVDFVVYDHNALSAITNFEAARIVDSENFAGSKAQVELNAGFKLRQTAAARLHKHA